MATLDDEIHADIVRLSKKGDEAAREGDDQRAVYCYATALKRLPAPPTDWEAATWLLTAIGDVYWAKRDLRRAHKAFYGALQSPGGIGNPYVHLRMGQIRFELGDIERARDELMRAYMGGDREIFEGEDPKYFAAIEELT